MRIIRVAARYTPEVEAALRSLMRSIEHDAKMRALGGRGQVDTDDSQKGDIVLIVGKEYEKASTRPLIFPELPAGPSEGKLAAGRKSHERRDGVAV